MINQKDFYKMKMLFLNALAQNKLTAKDEEFIKSFYFGMRKFNIIHKKKYTDKEIKKSVSKKDDDKKNVTTLFNKKVFINALKNGFDTEKEHFFSYFGFQDANIIFYGGVKPNLNPFAK